MFQRTLLRFTALLLLATAPLHALAGPKATLAAPAAEGLTQVEYSTAAVSKWTDLPMGTYRVPNSDVIISGHQKGGATGMLFGMIGIAIQGSINAHNGKEAMATAEQVLTFSIDDEAKAILQRAMAEEAFASSFAHEAGTTRKLEVTGAVVMSFANKTEVLPYVVLRVKLLGKNGTSKLWTTRYITSGGAPKPLVGEGSWTADTGAVLRPHVSALLERAIRVMLTDIAKPYPRDEAATITVQGYFPHVNKPLQVVGYRLAEQDGRVLFLPKLGTSIVFAGVNVIDTAAIVQRPTVKGDAPLKLLKPGEFTQPNHSATAAATAEASADDNAESSAGVESDTAEEGAEAGADETAEASADGPLP